MLGEEGHGIRTIVEMAHLTRLDFGIGSAGLMRQALHYVSNRRAFQRSLVDLPVMRNVLADLAGEAETLMWMGLPLALALERAGTSEAERLLSRIATPVAKYCVCKRAPMFVVEALECHGGNGFIEDHLMARLYREAPLNGIWEGHRQRRLPGRDPRKWSASPRRRASFSTSFGRRAAPIRGLMLSLRILQAVSPICRKSKAQPGAPSR
jgi:alkylation response protein AidB-like acyl-CoA dehydrogenase